MSTGDRHHRCFVHALAGGEAGEKNWRNVSENNRVLSTYLKMSTGDRYHCCFIHAPVVRAHAGKGGWEETKDTQKRRRNETTPREEHRTTSRRRLEDEQALLIYLSMLTRTTANCGAVL